jgi:hypothetical protein
VVSDLSEEEAASGFSVEKRLIVRSRELEVAIDVAGLAESQKQYVVLGIVRNRREHLRFER